MSSKKISRRLARLGFTENPTSNRHFYRNGAVLAFVGGKWKYFYDYQNNGYLTFCSFEEVAAYLESNLLKKESQ